MNHDEGYRGLASMTAETTTHETRTLDQRLQDIENRIALLESQLVGSRPDAQSP